MLRGAVDKNIMHNLCNQAEVAQINRNNPFYVGTVKGYKFYECPIYGDERPLLVKDKLGRYGYSYWCDLPEGEI
jgi:hypothetical protein